MYSDSDNLLAQPNRATDTVSGCDENELFGPDIPTKPRAACHFWSINSNGAN